jgi:hypothetical protein
VNFGLLREIREESPLSMELVGFGSEVKAHLREDPQLKEKNPQLIPRISKVVGPLQALYKEAFSW